MGRQSVWALAQNWRLSYFLLLPSDDPRAARSSAFGPVSIASGPHPVIRVRTDGLRKPCFCARRERTEHEPAVCDELRAGRVRGIFGGEERDVGAHLVHY